MATSGSVTTSAYDGRYYQLDWSRASYNLANNTTTISWTLKAVGGNSSYYAERTLKVVIGGKTVYTKTNAVNRYTGEVQKGSLTITHNDNGFKSIDISVQAAVYVTSVNCKGSGTFSLDPLDRKSTLSASNGTLGTALTLTVTQRSTNLTHTIKYKCGTVSGTICTKSKTTSFSWSSSNGNSVSNLASQNTTGDTVPVSFTITTYYGDAVVGSYTKKVTMSMPASVAPSCSVTVSDAAYMPGTTTTCYSKFGYYIKGKSKLSVTVSPTTSYSSPISAYKTTASGKIYTTSSFTTDALTGSGTLYVDAKVTDKRGRSGTSSKGISVLDYAEPVVSKVSVHRCVSATDGTESSGGSYVKVTYSGTIFSLNSKNTRTWQLKYKKYSASSYTTVTLSPSSWSLTNGVYTYSDNSYIFSADTASSYDIQVVATDSFTSTTRSTSVSSAYTMMHFSANGKGLGLGKVAEFDGLDVNFVSRFKGNVNTGKKTGYLDGLEGVHLNKEGYIHLQRNNSTKHPYLAFIHGASKALDCYIRYTQTSKLMEFMKATGYTFDQNIYVGETRGWVDGKTGAKLSPSGAIAIQGGNGTSPYIDFLKYGTKSGYDGRIQYNYSTNKMEFQGAADYDFDSGAVGLGSDDKNGATANKIYCWWNDGSAHNIIARLDNGLTAVIGWEGSTTYKTITEIRGQTVRYKNASGTTNLSDERMKKDFTDLDGWEAFFNALEPCAFRMKNGASGRYHIGFKAQQVEKALTENNLSTQDFAGFVKTKYEVDEDSPTLSKAYEEAGIKPGDDEYGLIYTEFTALNTYMIQKLSKENAELKEKVDDLEARLKKLEALLNV